MDRTMKQKLLVGRPIASLRSSAIAWPSALTVGRVLLSLIFLLSGINKFSDWSSSAAYMQSQGMGWVPFFLAMAGAIEVFGGLSLMTGTFTRLGAFLLFLYLIPVTFVFHDFWSLQGAERQMQMINFLKNLGLMGGLLVVAGSGAGALSVDQKIQSRVAGDSPEFRG